MKNIGAQEEAERLQKLVAAEADHQRFQTRPKAPAHRRTRPENQARIRAQQARQPELSAHHHDLTHMSDDDLASLADQLEELEADAGEE